MTRRYWFWAVPPVREQVEFLEELQRSYQRTEAERKRNPCIRCGGNQTVPTGKRRPPIKHCPRCKGSGVEPKKKKAQRSSQGE